MSELDISGGILHGQTIKNPTLEKLDRVLMSSDWKILFPSIMG
jgi:hypothetical protein